MINFSAFFDEMEKIAVDEATRASAAEKRGLSVPEHRLAVKARTAAKTHNRRLNNEARHLSDSIFLRGGSPDIKNYRDKARYMHGSGERAKVRRQENDLKARYPQPEKHSPEVAPAKKPSPAQPRHEAKVTAAPSPKPHQSPPAAAPSPKMHVSHPPQSHVHARAGNLARMGGAAAVIAGTGVLAHHLNKRRKQK